jgi:hypothetical protein
VRFAELPPATQTEVRDGLIGALLEGLRRKHPGVVFTVDRPADVDTVGDRLPGPADNDPADDA